MKTKLTLALVALITTSAFAGIPKVLPEFKNEKQLAEWREEMAAKAESEPSKLDVRSSTLDVPPAFYTGKPYIESTGSYAFKYRSYNPELARWTSEDPSGFPDGANSLAYIKNSVTSSIDYGGLVRLCLEEDAYSQPFNYTYETTWDWSISHNGTVVSSGTSTVQSCDTVAHNVGTYAGLDPRTGTAGTSITYNFAQRNSADSGWELNGWTVTAKIYEHIGASDSDLVSLNNSSSINQNVKPITRDSLCGMTTFLANQLGNAQYQGRWYVE